MRCIIYEGLKPQKLKFGCPVCKCSRYTDEYKVSGSNTYDGEKRRMYMAVDKCPNCYREVLKGFDGFK